MITEKFKTLIKKIFKGSEQGGISLQFKNASIEDILILRVIIADKIHEFRDISAGAATHPVLLDESPLYFYSYVITGNDKFYFEPRSHQLKKKIKKGKIIILIFIEQYAAGQKRVVMYPGIDRDK